jgi:hypothetical protein
MKRLGNDEGVLSPYPVWAVGDALYLDNRSEETEAPKEQEFFCSYFVIHGLKNYSYALYYSRHQNKKRIKSWQTSI